MINAIQPKTYEYIDKLNRGTNTVYGFIAQQVKEVLPQAVSIQTETIPNIYKIAVLNGNQLKIQDPSGERDLTQLLSVGDKVRLYDICNQQINVTVASVDSPSSFTVTAETPLTDTKYFVYGKEVSDFHTLNKEYIFTINVCATQELSRKVNTLQTELNEARQENAILKQRIDQLCAHLGLSF
jgi:cyclophilin family peptidyl-prolyl cis-trans isomerase